MKNTGFEVEAEAKEVILKSKSGAIAIVPVDMADDVTNIINSEAEDKDEQINAMVSKFPRAKNYAKDGTVVGMDEDGNNVDFDDYYATVPENKSDTSNYDLKTAYANLPYETMKEFAEGDAHLPDTYKKPSHPSFSNESIYSTEETPGGEWGGNDDDGWSFTPSAFNVEQAGGFDKVENFFSEQDSNVKVIKNSSNASLSASEGAATVNGMTDPGEVTDEGGQDVIKKAYQDSRKVEDKKAKVEEREATDEEKSAVKSDENTEEGQGGVKDKSAFTTREQLTKAYDIIKDMDMSKDLAGQIELSDGNPGGYENQGKINSDRLYGKLKSLYRTKFTEGSDNFKKVQEFQQALYDMDPEYYKYAGEGKLDGLPGDRTLSSFLDFVPKEGLTDLGSVAVMNKRYGSQAPSLDISNWNNETHKWELDPDNKGVSPTSLHGKEMPIVYPYIDEQELKDNPGKYPGSENPLKYPGKMVNSVYDLNAFF